MNMPTLFLMSILLNIGNGFTVKGPSGPLVVPLGGSVLLPCSVDSLSSVEDLEVEWKRSDTRALIHLFQDGDIRPEVQHEDYHDRAHFFTEDIKQGNFSLLMKNVTAQDEGQYTCTVHIGHESGETVVELKCGEHLVVSGSDQSISAYEGEDVTLNCSVDSHITPEDIEEVSWKKTDKDEHILVLLYQNNEAFPEASDEQYRDRVEFFSDEIHRGNFSLRLKRVRTEDKGLYMCHVFARGQSANTTVVLEQLGFSGLHIMVLILCISACGSSLLFCSLIYCRSNNTDTSRTVQALKVSLLICPNICMFIAFMIWGVTEGFLKETITCSALYILRPAMLFCAVPYLNDLQDSNKPWIRFLTIANEFAALTIIVYSVLFTYAWKQTGNYTSMFVPIVFGVCFGLVLLFCLCIFIFGCCGAEILKRIAILTLMGFFQFFFLLFLFTVPNPDFWDLTCAVFVKVLAILMVFKDFKCGPLQNVIVFMLGAVGIILLNSVALATELILKRRNGERAVGDLRLIVFPSESVLILCWVFMSCCCITESVHNKTTQKRRLPRNKPENHEMERFSAQ